MPTPLLRLAASLSLSLLVLAACDEAGSAATPTTPSGPKYTPVMTAELVPPALKKLVLGVATDTELVAAFGPGEVVKDKSLGGTAKVQYADKPALRITLPARDDVLEGEAWFVPDADGKHRLQRLWIVLKTTDTCAWIESHVGSLPGSTKRPGSNRKFGGTKGGLSYTAGSTDGSQAVGIECNASERDGVARESLTYALESESGSSMMVQMDP